MTPQRGQKLVGLTTLKPPVTHMGLNHTGGHIDAPCWSSWGPSYLPVSLPTSGWKIPVRLA